MSIQKRSARLWVAGTLAAGVVGAAALVAASSVGASGAKDPSSWKPWHLTSANQFRLGAPPAAKSATTKKELAQLRRFQRHRTPQMLQTIKKWVNQPSVIPWTDMFLQSVQSYRPRPPAASYIFGIFYTGMEDAIIAAYDSRDAYASSSRPAPSKLDPRIKPMGKPTKGSTWASPEAAMAGAAETLLPYLFSDAPPSVFHKAANDAINARLWACLNYRSDLEQGRLLGQKVAAAVIAHVKTDGRATATGFPYPQLKGDAYWSPTPPGYEPPFGGPAGKWRPWLMTSDDQFLHSIPGPSTYGSPEYMNQLLAVLNTVNNETQEQRNIAFFWDDGPGTFTPPGHWLSIAEGLIKKYHTKNENAVRILAYLGAAEGDAAVAAWHIKYFYWSVRPITAIWRLTSSNTLLTEAEASANPSLAPWRGKWYSPITTPAFPSYPSGHASFSGAGSTVLAYFFPNSAKTVTDMAAEAAQSRIYGGIHYPEDSRDGLIRGQDVGNLAVARAKAD